MTESARAQGEPTFMARLRAALRSRRRLERLNHILIPEKKAERDKARRRISWRFAAPLFAVHGSLSPEGRGLMLLSLFVGLAGVDVNRTQVNLFFGALFGLLLGSLLLRPFFRTRGLALRVEAPLRVSVGQAQRFLIQLHNTAPHSQLSLRMEGPFLPWDGKWLAHRAGVARLEPDERITLQAEARFSARGEHHLDDFLVAKLVPLGLAIGPRAVAAPPRFLVVPRIAPIEGHLLEHRSGVARSARRTSKAMGETELVGVRPYRPGDPLKHLHARTWARTGIAHVRVHANEQSERVALALAIDGLEATDEVKEAATSLAAGIASWLVRQGTGIDLLVIDETSTDVRPRTGRVALDTVLDRLATHVFSDRRKDIAAQLQNLGPMLSALILVAVDPRHLRCVEGLRERGIEVRAFLVSDDEETSFESATLAQHVSARRIEDGEVIHT